MECAKPIAAVRRDWDRYCAQMHKQYRLSNDLTFQSFVDIFRHYCHCAFDSEYVLSVGPSVCKKSAVKSFNLSRANICTEILTKYKFQNPNMFKTLAALHRAYKITCAKVSATTGAYCYIHSTKLDNEGTYQVNIHREDRHVPQSLLVSHRTIHFLRTYFYFIHVEKYICKSIQNFLRTQAWYYTKGINYATAIDILLQHDNSALPKKCYVQYLEALHVLKQST